MRGHVDSGAADSTHIASEVQAHVGPTEGLSSGIFRGTKLEANRMFFRAILSSPARQLRAARACYEATHMCSIRISTPDEQVRTPGLERTSISAMSLVNASTTERKSTPKTSCNPGALFRVL